MNTIRHFDGLHRVDLPPRPVHLAIGMFDGVHLGHQSVIEPAVHSAKRCGGLAGVMTFHPHPSRLLHPQSPTRLLMTLETKRRALARLDVDFLVEQPFTREFAALGPAEFVALVRRHLPNAKALYVGENWRFGRGREGDVATLVQQARALGLEVFSVPRVNHNGSPISSSRIRDLVESGAIEDANALLGYSYFSEGIVRSDRRLGRELGFPTLNLSWDPELRPRFGVYVVSVLDSRDRTALGVANYGLRPTVGDIREPLLEVHVLGETDLGPGDPVTVHWLTFLRAEQRFESLDALRAQIARDRQEALRFVARFAGP